MPPAPFELGSAIPRLQRRRTRIVATLGPASSSPTILRQLLEGGVEVVRLNMSHGDHDSHREAIRIVRSLAGELGRLVAVLADLAGPKIRTRRFRGGSIELVEGETVIVTTRDVLGEPGLIASGYAELARDVREGDRILLDDGNLELRVAAIEGTEIACRVVQGGILRDRKGMNLPGVEVSAPSLTDKDRSDAHFALEEGVDFLGLSFVRQASDVEALRELVRSVGGEARIVSKIEKPEAIEAFDEILAASDGIMVARGDLGVELPPEEVPVAQDLLVDRARAAGKPVIIATQMLESMMHSTRPTRAEASDVAYGVKSGADAVMLSGETAAGEHPVRTVRMMDRIVRATEGYLWQQGAFRAFAPLPPIDSSMRIGEAVARSTSRLSRELEVRMILVVSRSGATASLISTARPAAPVVAVSSNVRTCRVMNLLWGVVPLHVEEAAIDPPSELARKVARELGLAEEGECVLAVRGFRPEVARSEPSITVVVV